MRTAAAGRCGAGGAEVERYPACADAAELFHLLPGGVRADLESFDLAEPAAFGGFADALVQAGDDLREPDALLRSIRQRMQVRAQRDLTILLVTHDIDEAVYVADRVLTASPGRICTDLALDLPVPRDQITTREHPGFTRRRSQALRLIRTQPGPQDPGQPPATSTSRGAMNLTFATWNTLNGGIDKSGDTRLRRQLAILKAARPDVVAFQELTDDFTRHGDTLLHWAENQLGGMRGFLARSPHNCHLGIFIRESAGLRVIRKRHEQRDPYWHGVACVEVEADGFSRLLLASTHLAPSSPAKRLIEAEAFKLIAEAGALIAAGDFNAVPASGPDPQPKGLDEEHIRRKLDRSAARALEGARLTDVGAYLGDPTPTVGHWGPDKLTYRCDRFYTNLPEQMITSHRVLTDAGDCSDHLPVIAVFNLEAAA